MTFVVLAILAFTGLRSLRERGAFDQLVDLLRGR